MKKFRGIIIAIAILAIIVIFLVGGFVLNVYTNPSELNCCSTCLNHYNESNGENCINQDYSDGKITKNCYLVFREQNLTRKSCLDLFAEYK